MILMANIFFGYNTPCLWMLIGNRTPAMQLRGVSFVFLIQEYLLFRLITSAMDHPGNTLGWD